MLVQAQHVRMAIEKFRQPRTSRMPHAGNEEPAMGAAEFDPAQLLANTAPSLRMDLIEDSSDLLRPC